jgi:Tol biopolymer transport system component
VRRFRNWAAGVTCLAAALALPAAAQAVFPGANGPITFVSGIGGMANDDSGADLFIINGPGGAFAAGDARTLLPGQHRHPNWSPNGKKIAVAIFNGAADRDIWIHDVDLGSNVRLGGAVTTNIQDDRPAWSPDGTKLAYESEVSVASTQQDILIHNFKTGNTTNLTSSVNLYEGKPVWSPDGKFIYYARGLTSANEDIVREPSNNSAVIPAQILNSATAEYQPALSPDGTKLCFTRGPFGSNDADVYTVNSDGSGAQVDVSDNAGMGSTGDYNCAWSPDGTRIAFVKGVFQAGALTHTAADDSDSPTALALDTATHFDGNPDWARVRENCNNKAAGIQGTAGNDTIIGFGANDVIQALAGDDVVKAKSGKDTACGKGGADKILGGGDNDKLFGGGGVDTLIGGPGKDTCVGGSSKDKFKECEVVVQ